MEKTWLSFVTFMLRTWTLIRLEREQKKKENGKLGSEWFVRKKKRGSGNMYFHDKKIALYNLNAVGQQSNKERENKICCGSSNKYAGNVGCITIFRRGMRIRQNKWISIL